jgi:two-component system NtrC family sensor kinase
MALDPALGGVFLQGILKNTSETIFASDVRGRLAAFSRAGEATLGYARGELKGRPIEEIVADSASWDRLLGKCRREGSVDAGEIALKPKDGGPISGKLTLFALENAQGEFGGAAGIFVDILQETALHESLVRIDRLAEIGRTASDVAHEINNPLANINQISGWMGTVIANAQGLDPDDREELETAVRRIEEQVERCGRLARQLLAFARETGPRKTTFSVREILEKSVLFLNPVFKYRNIELVFDVGEEPLTVCSDSRMLEQVFVNLISNALYSVKQKGAGGRIVLRSRRRDRDAVVQVSDTGVGIPDEFRDKVGDLFFTTKPPGKGTGLGIPICRNLLRKLGGDMTFESEAGVGATFTVRIPLE